MATTHSSHDGNNGLSVSVIIPGYNCAGTIERCLKAVVDQDYPHLRQIIFVDDGSRDATPVIVGGFDRVQYLHQSNAGPARARNRGAASADSDLLAFIDADCIARQDWLTSLVSRFDSNEIGAVTGGYGLANPQSRLAYCIHKEILYRHRRYKRRDVRFFGSYNVCLPKKIFDMLGGYDSRFRNASGEDNDLSYRLLANGYKIRFESRAIVEHYHPESFTKYLKEQYTHGYWRARLYRAHPAMMQGDDYTFWKDIFETLMVILLGVFVMLIPLIPRGLIPRITVTSLMMFVVTELFFAWKMIREFNNGLWFAWVMFWRSFARTAGFLRGVLSWCRIGSRKPSLPPHNIEL